MCCTHFWFRAPCTTRSQAEDPNGFIQYVKEHITAVDPSPWQKFTLADAVCDLHIDGAQLLGIQVLADMKALLILMFQRELRQALLLVARRVMQSVNRYNKTRYFHVGQLLTGLPDRSLTLFKLVSSVTNDKVLEIVLKQVRWTVIVEYRRGALFSESPEALDEVLKKALADGSDEYGNPDELYWNLFRNLAEGYCNNQVQYLVLCALHATVHFMCITLRCAAS